MEQLMELHTRNGELDGWAYNEALKQQNPSLYVRMLDFRKIHNELESENIDAMKFIDHLLLTSRGARHGEIRQPQETISIVDNFYGLSSTTRDYLMKKFPALRTVFSEAAQQTYTYKYVVMLLELLEGVTIASVAFTMKGAMEDNKALSVD
ncbi:hypothetical protein TELCIR_19003 [Teladorsagia circumcincta]|uniref:Uncharacterized protein n=1 Tax=Teladorsagia circumcincta TaxID=45464 RepID=A0A2G9TNF2_TELCI|nr:hypothetical protein TELCIR_19003 [Teladorsagia circumcincta]